MLTEPVVVLGTPRSGTSLTAGLLAAHGVWTGACREPEPINPRGFFENVALRDLRLMGNLTRESVLDVLRSEGWQGGPWLAKHTPRYARAWKAFSPLWVLVRRPVKAVLASRLACGVFDETPRQAERIIERDNRMLDAVRGGIDVCPDAFMRGEFGDLERVLSHLGMTFDRAKAEAFMDPALWHH